MGSFLSSFTAPPEKESYNVRKKKKEQCALGAVKSLSFCPSSISFFRLNWKLMGHLDLLSQTDPKTNTHTPATVVSFSLSKLSNKPDHYTQQPVTCSCWPVDRLIYYLTCKRSKLLSASTTTMPCFYYYIALTHKLPIGQHKTDLTLQSYRKRQLNGRPQDW